MFSVGFLITKQLIKLFKLIWFEFEATLCKFLSSGYFTTHLKQKCRNSLQSVFEMFVGGQGENVRWVAYGIRLRDPILVFSKHFSDLINQYSTTDDLLA